MSQNCELISATVLHDELEKLRAEEKVDSFTELTKDMHFYPDLHGVYATRVA